VPIEGELDEVEVLLHDATKRGAPQQFKDRRLGEIWERPEAAVNRIDQVCDPLRDGIELGRSDRDLPFVSSAIGQALHRRTAVAVDAKSSNMVNGTMTENGPTRDVAMSAASSGVRRVVRTDRTAP